MNYLVEIRVEFLEVGIANDLLYLFLFGLIFFSLMLRVGRFFRGSHNIIVTNRKTGD
jgi:hypothetical protein